MAAQAVHAAPDGSACAVAYELGKSDHPEANRMEVLLQAHVNGKEVVIGPGSVLFFASMQPHAVQNVGDTPATYFVINWASPGSKTKKIPTPPSGGPAQ